MVGKLNRINHFSINNDAITWRAQLSFGTLLLLWGYIFSPTLKSILFALIYSECNQHVLFAIPLLLGLVYSKRSFFIRISPSVGQFGLILLLLLSAVWLFAQMVKIELFQQACVFAFIPAIFLLTFGYKISKGLIFPLSYIFLLLPVGNLVVPNIQHWLLTNLVQIFAWSNLPIYWEQQSIRTIYNILDITLLSDGLKFSLVFLAVGLVYAYFITVATWRRLIIALSFTISPSFFVLIGIYLLIYYDYFFCSLIMKPEQVVYYGWGLISIGLLFSIICGLILKQNRPYTDSLTKVDWQSSWRYSNFKWLRSTIIAVIIFSMVPVVIKNIQSTSTTYQQEIIYEHPNIAAWEGPINLTAADDAWQPSFSTANKSILSGYKMADKMVKLFSAYYYAPMQSSNIMHNHNTLYAKNVWQPINISQKKIHIKTEQNLEIIETILSNGSKHIIVWHWYYVTDMITVNKFLLPFLDAMRILFNKGHDVGVIAISTDVTDDVESDRQLLQQFLTDVGIDLKHLMYPRDINNR